jgi:NADH-quinone oxidoreductase subunit G
LTIKITDWVIEGQESSIKTQLSTKNYTRELDTVHIATEEGILKGREQDRKKN